MKLPLGAENGMTWSPAKRETDGGSSQRLRCDTVWLLVVLNGKDDGRLVK